MLILSQIIINCLLFSFSDAFFIYIRPFFFRFSYSNDKYPKYFQHYKETTIKELSQFIFENHYSQIGFINGSNFHSQKHQKKILTVISKLFEKISDPSKHKEYYQFYLKKKNW